MQIMPFEEAADYRFNPFDLTKIWPHEDYPLHEIGRMVLDRNPSNYFAESSRQPSSRRTSSRHRSEPGQDAARPVLLVPGHPPLPHRPELPAAADQRPEVRVHSYHRDGAMLYKAEGDPVYAPNSYGVRRRTRHMPSRTGAPRARSSLGLHQAAGRRRLRPAPGARAEVMDDAARDRLVATVTAHVSNGVTPEVRERTFDYWRKVDDEVGARIAKAVTNGG